MSAIPVSSSVPNTSAASQPLLRLIAPNPPQPQKPLFIFLPGLDGTGQLLYPQVAALSQGFDIRCLALAPANRWSWPVLVKRCLALLRATIFAHPRSAVYLCGESFGGCLALQLAAQAPQLFSRLVLINPASSFHRLPWMQWGAALSGWLPEPLYRLSNAGLMPFLVQSDRVPPDAREQLWQAMASVPAPTALWRVSLLSQFKAEQLPLAQLTLPTLLIAGQADALLPSENEVQRLAQQLPQAQPLTLPHSGHVCLLERGVNLYQLMDQVGFLSGITPDRHPDQTTSSQTNSSQAVPN